MKTYKCTREIRIGDFVVTRSVVGARSRFTGGSCAVLIFEFWKAKGIIIEMSFTCHQESCLRLPTS